ncbi:hypothetical protein [Atopobium sp. oral taxon 199]|uniref:hypothetical protein n=1 Tax=Atopobium sp. oral taxon 199 TaxID=712156 RepID=UPI00034E4844|nr:hypothetical protein [Atopobium sp. oral taxon 199]EPD78674.1 hypothetical protein HMPREF1527_01000 [Atopobium sp. oral taxon 199 str. F0494]
MADSRPPVPGEEVDELPQDEFIPAQVTAADLAPADSATFKLPSDVKVLWLLLKVQMLAVWTSQRLGRRRNGKRGANGLTVTLIIASGIGILVLGGYLYAFGMGLAAFGFDKLVPLIAVLIASLSGVVFTFAKSNGLLFGYKDYDFIMSLPVKKTVVIASRVGAMYSMEIFWALITMLPLYLGYFSTAEITPLRLLMVPISILLAPNLATSVTILLAWALTALGAKLHFKNFNTVIGGIVGMAIAMLYIVGVTWFSGTMSHDGESVEYLATHYNEIIYGMANTVGTVYVPSLLVANVFAQGNVLSLFIFIVLSVGSPALIIALLAKFNDRVNASVVTQTANKKFATSQISTKKNGIFRAMVLKEFRTLFGYPTYFFQLGFGVIICVILALVVAFFGVDGFIASVVEDDINAARMIRPVAHMIFGLMSTYFICMFVAASCSSAVAFSIEGHSNWLMATMPVTARQVFGSKVVANMLYVLVGLLLTNGILLISGNIALGTAARNFIVPLCFCFFATNLGMAIDVRRPNFDWTNITEITKRSIAAMVSSLVGVFGSMLILGVSFALFALPSFVSMVDGGPMMSETPLNISMIGVALIFGAIGYVIFTDTVRRGVKI